MDDRVDLADIGEELVAEAFALAGAAHQPGDIDEADLGRHDLRRLGDRGEASSRGSGTATSPVFGSIVQNG